MDGETAAQRAYSLTKDEILSGEIAPGALLSEIDIADRLAVSRTPVHEAFLRLESEDLLRLIPRRGAVVAPIAPTEAADVLDVRVALETAAVRRLADPARDLTALLADLADLVEQQSAFAAAHDIAGFAVVDAQFHRAIVTAADNAIADRFYASLADRQRRMTAGAVRARPERLTGLVDEHRALASTVAARDVAGFAELLQRHLDATHNLFHSR